MASATVPWHISHRESDGGYSISEPVHFPSARRLHQWGGTHLGGSAALALPARATDLRSGPRYGASVPESPRTQRSISLHYPLSTKPDEVIAPPQLWSRQIPNAKVLQFLGGAGEESPRLGPFDRTVHQRPQDVHRGSSYVSDYCRPAAMRTTPLPPIDRRVPTASPRAFGATATAVTFDATAEKAALDAPYDASRHGSKSIMPPRTHVFVR